MVVTKYKEIEARRFSRRCHVFFCFILKTKVFLTLFAYIFSLEHSIFSLSDLSLDIFFPNRLEGGRKLVVEILKYELWRGV